MEDSKEKMLNLCVSGMAAKGLLSQEFKDRLKVEIKEIENQAEYDYFLELYEKRAKFKKNENNLLVPYLLGLTDEFDISSDPAHIQGEFPDIDVDYIPVVQEYLRKEWCPRRFGRDKVVNIGNYGTFGIKSALLDMARVHGADYQEIQTITKNLQDKDDEGKPLTWDKAIEVAPDLAAYCEKNPEIADSAKRLIDRNRGRGKHAGGTVVSNINISDLVPVMNDTDGNPVSGWTEGLHDQDLQPVGLIKFDILAVKDLLRIAHCCHLVKQRHPEVKSISAVEGGSDWSNTSYLNDRKALELANKSETRGIFQFDGEGMRKLIKAGGVDRFEDLVAYSSIFRPAALGLKMHERYVERKKGREEWKDQIPTCLREILADTYGILIYQESVMRVLNVVGDIPLIHCEKIRKAISKKKVKEFIKYKQMFLENGSKKTGWPIESDDEKNMNFLWTQLENFSSYGFNKSMHQDTYIPTPEGSKKICDFQKGDKVYCVNESGRTVETEVVRLHDHGSLECYSVVFDDGYEVVCTLNHKFLTQRGQIPLHEILAKDISVFCEKQKGDSHAKKEERRMGGEVRGFFCDEKVKKQSSNILSKMSRIMFQDRQLGSSLRDNFFSQEFAKKASAQMSRVSQFGLGRKNLDFPMSNRFPNLGDDEQASQGLQRMQEDKTGEHKGKKFKNEPIRGSQKSILNCCEKNLGSTGDSSPEGGTPKKMERGESGEIRQKYRGCMEKPKEIKNGSVAATAVGLEDEKDSLRKKSRAEVEASRYGEGQNMDRSGWILSFLRACKKQYVRRLSSTHSSTKGRHAEPRVSEEERCHSNKGGYVVFPQQHGTNELGMVGVVPEYASISDTRSLVSRKIVRVVPVGRQQCYDLEVACSTHNFILPNGAITSNSHAVAYTHTSSRLLYLKAHYPLEFFCSTLGLEGDEDKVKIYKREAERSGIKINRCDLNKSKVNYEIVGEEIYVGFSNIKGVGKEVAERIVSLQPFSGFPDFLDRFGTDKRIVESLVCLKAFKDAAPNVLLEFYEDYKKWSKGNIDKEKRQMKRRDELAQSIKSMLKEGSESYLEHNFLMNVFESGDASAMNTFISKEFSISDVFGVVKKYAKSALDFEHKANFSKTNSISFENWTPQNRHPSDKWPNIFELERKYYGFSWEHPIQKSSDYIGGHSFGIFKDNDDVVNAGVEVMITKGPQEKKSKKGNKYHFVLVEDEDWNVEVVTFWSEDYARFEEELKYWNEEQKRGHFMRLRLTRPGSGFKSYTFESPSKAVRYKLIPADKKNDPRLQIMESPM